VQVTTAAAQSLPHPDEEAKSVVQQMPPPQVVWESVYQLQAGKGMDIASERAKRTAMLRAVEREIVELSGILILLSNEIRVNVGSLRMN
jgi:CHASE1-domain containing sensor protein